MSAELLKAEELLWSRQLSQPFMIVNETDPVAISVLGPGWRPPLSEVTIFLCQLAPRVKDGMEREGREEDDDEEEALLTDGVAKLHQHSKFHIIQDYCSDLK